MSSSPSRPRLLTTSTSARSHPGSCGIVDATDAYAEGLQFNAIKIEEEGRRNDWIWRFIRDNVRAAQLVVGDMEAQVAACRIGAERFAGAVERYGIETVQAASEDLMDYSERLLRSEIEKLPDGSYEAEGFIDGFQEHPDPANRDLRVQATVTVDGSDMHVDLTGTSPQIDLPLNMPFEGTVDIAVYLTVRSILLDSDRHGQVPANSGLFRPITITAPGGLPREPALPGARRSPASAPATSSPTRSCARSRRSCPTTSAPASATSRSSPTPGLADGGQHWVYMDIQEGSYGGRYGKDGLDAVDTLYANTRNNPIEDIESHYPLRVTRYELNVDTGGAGPLARRARNDPRDRVPRAGRHVARGRRLRASAARAVRRRRRDARARRDQPSRRERRRGAVQVPLPRDAAPATACS